MSKPNKNLPNCRCDEVTCGKAFFKQASIIKAGRNFCSRECYNEHKYKKSIDYLPRVRELIGTMKLPAIALELGIDHDKLENKVSYWRSLGLLGAGRKYEYRATKEEDRNTEFFDWNDYVIGFDVVDGLQYELFMRVDEAFVSDDIKPAGQYVPYDFAFGWEDLQYKNDCL